MLRFLLHSDSLFGKVLTIISTIVVVFFVIVVITDNPFSSYTTIDEVEEEKPVSIDQLQFDSDRSHKDYYDKENDQNIYILSEESEPIINPRNPKELKVIETEKLAVQEYYYLSIDKILDYRGDHPIKPLKFTSQGDLLILGTTSSGYDLLSKITASVSKTFVLMFYTMASFLFFGIISGVLIGYYRERFVRSIRILEFTIKTLESTPLLLWMLLSVIIIQRVLLDMGKSPEFQLSLIFVFLGFFSSPSLSKIITNKFEMLKSQDFVVALKLLGVNDRRIIISHILRHFCFSSILFQASYICAQVLFFDFTLQVLRFSYHGTLGSELHTFYVDKYNHQFPLYTLIFILFFFTTFLFYSARFFESKAKS